MGSWGVDLGTAGKSQAPGESSCGPSPCFPPSGHSQNQLQGGPGGRPRPGFELSLSYSALCLGPSEVGSGWVGWIGQ